MLSANQCASHVRARDKFEVAVGAMNSFCFAYWKTTFSHRFTALVYGTALSGCAIKLYETNFHRRNGGMKRMVWGQPCRYSSSYVIMPVNRAFSTWREFSAAK